MTVAQEIAEVPWWRTLRRPAPVLLRWALGLFSLLLGLVSGMALELLPWLVIVLLLDTVATYVLDGIRPLVRLHGFPALVLLAMAAAAAAGALTAGPGGLPLLLIPAFQAGARLGARGTAAVVGVQLATAFIVGVNDEAPLRQSVTGILQAVTMALIVGLIAAWATAIRRTPREETLLQEASDLLRRLHDVAEGLDTGFDGPASAERALAELAGQVPLERAAVLVTYNDVHSTPVALLGAQRVPWPDPAEEGSLLHSVWRGEGPMTTTWLDDGHERTVAAAPLIGDSGNRVGILVLDRDSAPLSKTEVSALEGVAERHARAVDVAITFEWLRSRSALEERTRLSRLMHDGLAQELAALGYRVDAIRALARRSSSNGGADPLVEELDDLRGALSSAMVDIRLHIVDLRVGDHLDSRLGAVISSRLQTFGAFTGIGTTIALNESGLRLPANVEVMLYRLVLDVLEDARRSQGTTAVEVHVFVSAPEAEVLVSHDGASGLTNETFSEHPLRDVGARVTVSPGPGAGVTVRATVPHLTTHPMREEPSVEMMLP